MKAEHTPTPWALQKNGPCFNLNSPDQVDHFAILVGMLHNNPGELQANAAHIARCVNAHDDLLAACKAAERRLVEIELNTPSVFFTEDLAQLRAAIAKADAE